MFQESFKGLKRILKVLSRKFQGCFMTFKGIHRVFQRCFKEVSRKFQGCFTKVSWKRSVMDVSRVFNDFQGCFQSVSRKFQENFQGVSKQISCFMALIAAS